MMARRIAWLGTVAVLVLALSGCISVQPKPDGTYSFSLFPPSSPTTVTGGGSSGSTSSGSGSSGSKTSRPTGPVMPGTPQTSGPWKVNVESTEAPKSLPDGTKPHKGKRFMVVDVSVRNVGSSQALIVRSDQFRLIDSHGVEVKPFPTSMAAFNAREVKPVESAMGGFTAFVYEIPSGTANYGFVVTPKQGATGSMSWIVP